MSAKPRPYAGGPVARYLFLGSVLFLTAFGLVMIFSASSITASVKEGNAWYFFNRQLIAVLFGFAVAVAIARFDYRLLKPYVQALWGIGLALLVVVLAINDRRSGATRWIPIGSFQLQPSEYVKIACVLLVAAIAVEWQRRKIPGKTMFGKVLFFVAAPAFLIILQPDMGTMATLVVAVVFVLFLADVDMKWLVGSGTVAAGLAALFVWLSHYRMDRVLGFLDPLADPRGKGYQIVQAWYAFGTGGLSGVGLGLSRQKFFYLPEAHTDFILAIIGEEAGLIGTLAVLVAFVVLVWAGFKIASGSRDPYGRLVAGSLTGMIAFQAILNVAAVTGWFPVTGKPLPFLSYGGSSVIFTMMSVGLILSVSRHGAMSPRAVKARPQKKERMSEGTSQRRGHGGAHISRAGRGRDARRRA